MHVYNRGSRDGGKGELTLALGPSHTAACKALGISPRLGKEWHLVGLNPALA